MTVICYPLKNYLNCYTQEGDVGIEIELEGNKFPKAPSRLKDSRWVATTDGSLRGQDNCEYVLNGPIPFAEVDSEVRKLWEILNNFGTVISESNRTSVHVHLNMQNFHKNRICAFAALYYIVEEFLTNWCGENRVGNLFCLRTVDAPEAAHRLQTFLASDFSCPLQEALLKYSSLNIYTLVKFGSFEIRTLRGVEDPDTVITWVNILKRLYDLSAEFPDPREICNNFSGGGPLAFVQNILGSYASEILNRMDISEEGLEEIAFRGVRIAQNLCYSQRWENFTYSEMTPNPWSSTSPISISQTSSSVNIGEILNTLQVVMMHQEEEEEEDDEYTYDDPEWPEEEE